MPRDDAYLLDIAHAARLIRDFVQGIDLESFLGDEKTLAATLHEFTILGEAVNRLSEEFKERHSEIQWQKIVGLRNRVVHEYDRVDLEEIWKAATRDIPRFIQSLEPLLPKENG